MGTALSIILTLFVHLMHPANAAVTANAQVSDEIEPSVSPTVVPIVTPTDTPSVTPTITPTVMPTVTPTVTPSVTPTGDGDKDDMLGIKSDIHALSGLVNAAFHHEQNESRFETKHDSDKQ